MDIIDLHGFLSVLIHLICSIRVLFNFAFKETQKPVNRVIFDINF